MDMTFSADNRAEILVLPFVSVDTSVDEPQNNDTFTGLSRDINLIGPMGLRTLTINSWFPDRPLRFGNQSAPIGAQIYIQFFRRWREAKVPLRVACTDTDGSEILNMPCTIDTFSWQPASRMGRISYSLTAREYNLVTG